MGLDYIAIYAFTVLIQIMNVFGNDNCGQLTSKSPSIHAPTSIITYIKCIICIVKAMFPSVRRNRFNQACHQV